MPSDAVTVAYVHPNEIAHSFHASLLNMLNHDIGSHGRIARGGWIAVRCYGADGLPAARNYAVTEFLKDKDSDWLFFIDTDMGFAPDTVDRLLEFADPQKRPIVGGLCFAQKANDPDGMGGWRMQIAPTIFEWHDGGEGSESGFMSRRGYSVNSLVQVAGTGSACILIHRSVFVKLADKYGPEWYHRVANPTAGNKMLGEDLSFCLRAGALGIPVYIHTGVRTTHYKSLWLSEQDYWLWLTARPATEKTSVIVPVMRRPQNAQPFMDSLRASTGLAKVYAICDVEDKDTVDAWRTQGAKIVTMPHRDRPGSFAEKVNHGYRHTSEPWLTIVGDDVRFYRGWLDHAQEVAGDRFHVIGTNDLHNPRSLHGDHSVHLVIRRSHVDECGASWDGPKCVAHEGYRHWYVDDEIVTAAKQQNVWAMAMGSVIEHLHPLWNLGDMDDVYRLGQSFVEQDLALFKERVAYYAQ